MEDFHFEPGLFSLPLVINRGHYLQVQVDYKKSVLEGYLQKKLHRPERHAIRNLLGLLAARLEQYEEALDYFTQVESEDSTNLNALANRKSLCEILYRFNEASRCANQLRILQTTSEAERHKGSDGEIDLRKREARCLAEQAYAFAFDIFDDSEGCARYLKSHQNYSAAMRLAGDYVDIDERQDWEFTDAIVCKKIYRSMDRASEPYDSYVVYLHTSLWHFYKLTQSDDDDMKAECWRHMGEIFVTIHSSRPVYCVRDHPELEPYFKDPKKCITKALEIAPRSPQLNTRLAQMIRKEQPEESLRLLSQSIEIDSSQCNRYAFAVRGELYLNTFRKQMQRYENNGSADTDPPDRNLLRLAEKDVEKALSLNVSPREFTNLACIWHYRAKDENGHLAIDKESKDYVDKALMYHAKAINCKNGAMHEDINRQRGLCLLDAKEYDAAIESFKRAMECQSATNKNPFTFFLLMRVYLTIISELELDESGSIRLLTELTYWTEEAIRKCGEGKLLWNRQTDTLWNEMPREMNMFIDFCNISRHHRICSVFSHQSFRRFNSRGDIPRNPREWRRSGDSQTRRSQNVPTETWSQPIRYSHRSLSESNSDDTTNERSHDREHQRICDRDARRSEGGETANPTLCGNRFQVLADEVEEESSPEETTQEPEAAKLVKEEPSIKTTNETETPEEEENKMINQTDIKTEEILEPPESARFVGHTYDFFAIYPDSAGDWVHYRLLPMLERVQHLKGCIKERGFMPGRYVVDNYSTCIETSASYLMIITKDFHRDRYCKYAMKQCLHPSESDPDQPRRVIPVMAEECEMPKELAFKTHFKATGSPNWDLLVDAIKECADTPVLE